MPRRIITALILGVCLVPMLATAAYRVGVGAHSDILSQGLEFTFWCPAGSNAQLFISPKGFGAYYFEEDLGFYSLGLRLGVMYAADRWLSPLVGIGGGYTYSAYYDKSEGYGGRLFVGFSIAPFHFLSREIEWLDWTDAIRGLRIGFDSGLHYRHYLRQYEEHIWDDDDGNYHIETIEEKGHLIRFPDFGAGISFNW